LKKLFLVIIVLSTGLSYAQSRSYPVFPDGETFPEKSSVVPIVLAIVLSIFIIALIVFIIRKSKERGRKIIVDGFNIKMSGKQYLTHSLFRHSSSSKYSKRRDKRGGVSSGRDSGGIGGGGFGSAW
jgi:uncharacterized membrane protein YgcG